MRFDDLSIPRMNIHIKLIQICRQTTYLIHHLPTYYLPHRTNPKTFLDAQAHTHVNMGRPTIQLHKKAKAWTRIKENGAETKEFDVEKRKDVQYVPGKDRPSSYKVTSREQHHSPPKTQVPVARAPPPAVHLSSTSLASAAPIHSRERPYVRGLPKGSVVSYSAYPPSAISEAPSHATTRSNLTNFSRTPSVTHSIHSTHAVSVVSDGKSHASTNSVTRSSVPGEPHQHLLQAVPIPSQDTTSSRAQSAVSTAPRTASENYLPSPVSRDSSRTPRATSDAPSHVSGIYPSLTPSRDSSCAARSRVPESTTPASESRLLTYRAPSVVTVTSSTISDQHPLLPASTPSSVIHSLQPSRAPSVASATRNTVSEDHRVFPAPVSRSPSIAPSSVSVNNESSEYLQESHSRDPSRAPSLQVSSPRASSSRALSSRTASVAPSIRSEHISSTVSAAQIRDGEEYVNSVINCGPSEVERSARSRRPSVIQHTEEYAAPVPERAQSIAASTRSSIKSGRNERDISIASTSRRHAREEDYEPKIQSKSTSKRASSIKPSRSGRGGSIASKARSYIGVDEHESSSEREPTSRRALSKVGSSKSSRKASRDDRGRSTTSLTKGPCNELANVEVTYTEHEDDRIKGQFRSKRSKSASTRRSSSVSSVDTICAGPHNAIAVRSADRPFTAEAPGDGFRLRSSRSKKNRDDDNLSVYSYHDDDSSDVTVVRPDPTEVSVVGPASTPYDQQKQQQNRKQWQDQQEQYRQQQQQRYHPQPYTQPYQQPYQQQYQRQAPYPAYGTPAGYPQYTNHQSPNQQYPNPRYAHPPPTAQPSYRAGSARDSSQYVTPTPQYETEYANLGEELEQGRKSGRLPKARDKRREKVQRPRRTTRLEEADEESALVYEEGDGGDFPPGWFDRKG